MDKIKVGPTESNKLSRRMTLDRFQTMKVVILEKETQLYDKW